MTNYDERMAEELKWLDKQYGIKAKTREEVEAYYDSRIESNARQWGEDNYYTQLARNNKVAQLQAFDEGKKVICGTSSFVHDSMDWEYVLYSDGTYALINYGYND